MSKIAWLVKVTLFAEAVIPGSLSGDQKADMFTEFENRWTPAVQLQCAALVVGDYPEVARRDSMDLLIGEVLLPMIQIDESGAVAFESVKGQSWTSSGGGLHIGNLASVMWTDGSENANPTPWRFTFETTDKNGNQVHKEANVKFTTEVRQAMMR